MADNDTLNTVLGAAIGGAVAIKILDVADRPRTRVVTRTVYRSRPAKVNRSPRRRTKPNPFSLNMRFLR